jgi:hypothetical protein
MKSLFIALLLLVPLKSLASPGMPKTIVFLKDGLGATETFSMDELEISHLVPITVCDKGVGWYHYNGPSLSLKTSTELRFVQSYGKKLKLTFENDIDCKLSSEIYEISVSLVSAKVPDYEVELIIGHKYQTIRLRTPNGDVAGNISEVW